MTPLNKFSKSNFRKIEKIENNLYRLIYCSRPFGFDTSVLNGLLIDSRENNQINDITGSLLCRADIYLQMLEGPKDSVLRAFDRIKRDDRHVEVRVLLKGTAKDRLFPNWAMKDDPVESWMWSRKEIADGSVEKSSGYEILEIFKKVADYDL